MFISNKLKINKKELMDANLGFFLFSAFIFPEYLTYSIKWLSTVTQLWFWAAITLISINFLIHIRANIKKLRDCYLPLALICIFELYYLVVTAANGGEYTRIISQGFRCICMCLLGFQVLTNRTKGMLKGALLYFEVLTYITLILIILFPKGLYNLDLKRIYCFLGHQNTVFRTLLPGLILSIINSFDQKGKLTIRSWSMLCAVFANTIMLNASTALAALGLTIICLLLFGSQKRKFTFFTFKNIFLGSICLCILVVFLENLTFYSNFVENILGKSMTFSGRTLAWDRALLAIYKNPVFGYGYKNDTLGYFFWQAFDGNRSCHNFYLDIVYRTGVIGITIIVILILASSKLIDRMHANSFNKVLSILSISYFISWNFEPFVDNELCYALLPILLTAFCFSNACSFKILNNT